MAELPKFTMQFEPMTIEHLGLRLYNSLPPVITELVSNAYDAEAPAVEVTLPTGEISEKSEVVVRDYGHGLSPDELQADYLPIGRNRRGDDSSVVMSKNGMRVVTGRKGLGKLSAFGIAAEMVIRSVVDGKAIALKLVYEDMKKWPVGTPYEPKVIAELSGSTTDANGVEIRMKGLKRKYKIDEERIRKGLAQRLDFIGTKFKVTVNGTGIKPGDRVQKSQCDSGWSWDLKDTPVGDQVGEHKPVTGWIGFLNEASATGRGVDIFAHGKAAELGSFFNLSSTHAQFPRAYLVGHVDADFLDEPGGDLISTARNGILWEQPAAQELQTWGEKLLTWAFGEWVKLRKQAKVERIIKVGKFDQWLKTRDPREQKQAQRMVSLLVDDERVDANTAEPLLEIIKVSIETAAFTDLLEEMEEKSASASTLLGLFGEWRIIEAREHLRLADGRRAVLEQLDTFMKTGALEVQQMQPLLRDNPWLLDPAWIEVQVEQTYSEQIRKHAKEKASTPEEDRRVDIMGISHGKELTIVEIKRPEKVLSRDNLEQIEEYVDWARNNLVGTGPDSFAYIRGLLVVGSLGTASTTKDKRARLAGTDIRVQTFADLLRRSTEFYEAVEDRLRTVAPEYSRAKRKAKKTNNED